MFKVVENKDVHKATKQHDSDSQIYQSSTSEATRVKPRNLESALPLSHSQHLHGTHRKTTFHDKFGVLLLANPIRGSYSLPANLEKLTLHDSGKISSSSVSNVTSHCDYLKNGSFPVDSDASSSSVDSVVCANNESVDVSVVICNETFDGGTEQATIPTINLREESVDADVTNVKLSSAVSETENLNEVNNNEDIAQSKEASGIEISTEFTVSDKKEMENFDTVKENVVSTDAKIVPENYFSVSGKIEANNNCVKEKIATRTNLIGINEAETTFSDFKDGLLDDDDHVTSSREMVQEGPKRKKIMDKFSIDETKQTDVAPKKKVTEIVEQPKLNYDETKAVQYKVFSSEVNIVEAQKHYQPGNIGQNTQQRYGNTHNSNKNNFTRQRGFSDVQYTTRSTDLIMDSFLMNDDLRQAIKDAKELVVPVTSSLVDLMVLLEKFSLVVGEVCQVICGTHRTGQNGIDKTTLDLNREKDNILEETVQVNLF